MKSLVKAWPCFASVLLLLLAFPPFNLSLLIFVAPVPWIVSLRKTSLKGSIRSSFTFGYLFMVAANYWVIMLTYRWTGSIPLAIIPWLLIGLVTLPGILIAGPAIHLCWRYKLEWLIPIMWASGEVIRAYLPPFAHPWAMLATPLWPYPAFLQNAYYGSIFLMSAWVMLGCMLGVKLLIGGEESSFKALRIPLGIFLFFLAPSFARFMQESPSDKHVFLIGQPGVDMAFGHPKEEERKINEAVDEFYTVAQSIDAEMILLPEAMTQGGETIPPYTPFRIEDTPPIIFGGTRGYDPIYQSSFAYDGEWSYADKTRLVMFGEFVPGRDWLPLMDQFNIPSGEYTPGSEIKSLKVNDLQVGPVICFEVLFPDIAHRHAQKGADILAVMSIDDWYMGTGAPDQLRAVSVWRAIETGLPVLRAASQGYSFAVDTKGDIITQAPLYKRQPIRVEIDIPKAPTPSPTLLYFMWAFGLSCPVMIVYGLARRKQELKG